MPLTGDWGVMLTHLSRIARLDSALGEHVNLQRIGEEIAERARDKLGSYQPAVDGFESWPPLADETKAARVAAGFPADEPLLRTGTLRDSIDVTTMDNGKLVVAGVPGYAASADYALVQEMGSISGAVPARPFMGPAFYEMQDQVAKEIEGGVKEGLRP